MKSCLKLLNEAGENVTFVHSFCFPLPPITFNIIDVSYLFGKIKRLSADKSLMRAALSTQTNICYDLRVMTTTINHCLYDVGKHGEQWSRMESSP